MNKIIQFIIIFAASIVFAQANDMVDDQGVSDDLVEFVTADEMPVPLPKDAIKKMKKKSSSIAIASDGFSAVGENPEEVKGFFNSVKAVKTRLKAAKMQNAYASQLSKNAQQSKDISNIPEAFKAYKDLSELNLTFSPSEFSEGELIAAVPSGTIVDNAWTGVERFFKIPGVGVVRLTEFDQAAAKGMLYVLEDNVNTDVHGKKAVSRIITDGDSQQIEDITWVSGKMMYILTFGPDLTPEDGASSEGIKSKAAPDISALSLALELH
jgi:hypothetical protein